VLLTSMSLRTPCRSFEVGILSPHPCRRFFEVTFAWSSRTAATLYLGFPRSSCSSPRLPDARAFGFITLTCPLVVVIRHFDGHDLVVAAA
jgi:hypothetical protein